MKHFAKWSMAMRASSLGVFALYVLTHPGVALALDPHKVCSDRHAKNQLEPVDPRAILAQVDRFAHPLIPTRR